MNQIISHRMDPGWQHMLAAENHEACAADVTDLGTDAGHRVLRVTRKGARKAKVPLAAATVAAPDAYLADHAGRCGLSDARQLAMPLRPPLAAAASGRGTCGNWCAAWPAMRASKPGTSCPRAACGTRRITFALDAGAALRDVQDYTGHKDPRTTRRQSMPGTAWTATPPTRSRPTSPDQTHSRRLSVARPLRLRPGSDLSRASRPDLAQPSASRLDNPIAPHSSG